MENDQDEIKKLLRLKRFEQPSQEYFDGFLRDFKERQRAQMLREPAWRIGWDRVCAFLGEQMPARIGYGLASTAVLVVAGVTSMNILESRPLIVASASAPAFAGDIAEAGPSLRLNSQPSQLLQLPKLPSMASTTSFSSPRHVMDAQLTSYEPPSSF